MENVRSMRPHPGENPEGILYARKDGALNEVLGEFRRTCFPLLFKSTTAEVLGIITCLWGKHRSVAFSRVLWYMCVGSATCEV